MAFQAVPDCAEVVIKYTGAFQDMVNVVHASLSGGYDLADLTALADAVDAAVATNWLPLQDNDFNYVNTTVRGLAVENDQEVVNNDGAAAGGIAGSAQPGNVTLSVKRTSGLTGRSARGRLYWIGMPAVQLAANKNTVTQAAADDITDAIDDIRIAINATAWTPAIVSRFTGGAKRTTGIFFNWVDTVCVNLNMDSQRRRLTP